jgi:hypothetical protein
MQGEERPLLFRRTALARTGSQRSLSRNWGSHDSQRDVNEGTTNVLRSIQANFMTMQGQSGKNNGYPFFDGTFKCYPKFRRRWHTFQSIYHNLMPQREMVHLFRDNCMDKKVADKIQSEETMAECWRLLDSFYSHATLRSSHKTFYQRSLLSRKYIHGLQ